MSPASPVRMDFSSCVLQLSPGLEPMPPSHAHICESINITLAGVCLMTHQKVLSTSEQR